LIDKDELIIIGKITKPVGLKGELKVLAITDFPKRFSRLKSVFILSSNEKEILTDMHTGSNKFKVRKVTGIDSAIRILFDKYDRIEDVSFLRNCYICVEEKDRYKLPKNLYYFYELIGCDVYYGEDLIGKVVNVENYGSSDVFSVLNKVGNRILIPFIKEFTKNVDIKNKKISVTLIEGFI
jgi:16S rRNA processing protein RimM